jgi:hypothetical protein
MSETPDARAATRSRRMAWDFEAGILMVPEKRWGLMRARIGKPTIIQP